MAQSYLRNPSIERLPTIMEELYSGSYCIPPFQRDFVWKGGRRLALCDSVGKGLPTGSVMVWRTARPLKGEPSIGPFILDPLPQDARQYLLDGRQRMTTLFAALAAGFWTRDAKELPSAPPNAVTAPDGTPWAIVFDLVASAFRFEPRTSGAPTDKSANGRTLSLFDDTDADEGAALLPLAVLFDDSAYDAWRSRAKLSRELTNRARAVRSAFMDYQIPVVPLSTEDISVVTLTFKRVNEGGTPAGTAAMMRALSWSESFDLSDHIAAVRTKLAPIGWGEVEEDALLAVATAVAGLDPTEDNAEKLAAELKKEPTLVEMAGDRMVSTANFLLENLGIAGPGSLPYTQIIVFVARAFHLMNGCLTPSQKHGLRAWAAEVCLDERFGGAPPHMIKADWRAVAHRLGIPIDQPLRPRDTKLRSTEECWTFSMAWARSRGSALVLAAQKPRNKDGVVMTDAFELVAHAGDGVAMLIAEGAMGLPPPLENRLRSDRRLSTALRSPANRIVCPYQDLPELRERLCSADCPREILESHLVDVEAHAALVRGDLREFFEGRRRAILTAERMWVIERGGNIDLRQEPRTYAEG